jgi:hypothetical protein
MVLFVTIALGRVRCRSTVGGVGVLIVTASGVAAYGLCSAFNIPFTALQLVSNVTALLSHNCVA